MWSLTMSRILVAATVMSSDAADGVERLDTAFNETMARSAGRVTAPVPLMLISIASTVDILAVAVFWGAQLDVLCQKQQIPAFFKVYIGHRPGFGSEAQAANSAGSLKLNSVSHNEESRWAWIVNESNTAECVRPVAHLHPRTATFRCDTLTDTTLGAVIGVLNR
jgi:hypothetical protein